MSFDLVFHVNRKDAESAKKRYFSFAVDPPKIAADRKDGNRKNQSLREISGL